MYTPTTDTGSEPLSAWLSERQVDFDIHRHDAWAS